MAPPRALSLTEELEKLEQSITLTLQEIDSNFAKAHRVVTTSILPIVDRYARNSEQVWEGARFWKEFFEASANVSLSNYEENAVDDSTVNHDAEESGYSTTAELLMSPEADGDATITSPPPKSAHTESDNEARTDGEEDDETNPLLTSPSIPHHHSTPRQRAPKQDTVAKINDLPSPFETLRRQMRGDTNTTRSKAPITPGKRPPALPDMTMTPAGSSPFALAPGTARKDGNQDTILHQGILGKTYRTKATPLATRRHVLAAELSSPLEDGPEPQLRAEIFSSPIKAGPPPTRAGVSVATPGRRDAVDRWREERRRSSKGALFTTREEVEEEGDEDDFGTAVSRGRTAGRDAGGFVTSRSVLGGWESDEEIPEMSPPKTMRFEFGRGMIIKTPGKLFSSFERMWY
jgi:DASH complex subunit ASK1